MASPGRVARRRDRGITGRGGPGPVRGAARGRPRGTGPRRPRSGGGRAPPVTALDDATRAIAGGSLVVIPTDTVYGIACRPDDAGATARLFEPNGRPRD